MAVYAAMRNSREGYTCKFSGIANFSRLYAPLRIGCKGLTPHRTTAVRGENNPGAIDDHLARVLEVDRDPGADRGLHLAETPVGLVRVAHEIARLEKLLHTSPSLRRGRIADVMTTPDLGALIAARLCHDLISPMGAIRNGLELMQMSANPSGPAAEVELVSESLETALAKLRYYRLAFGPADPEGRQAFTDAVQVTDGMFAGRFNVIWNVDGRDMARPLAQVVYLSILCLEKSMPMGGLVQVRIGEERLGLQVEGRKMVPPMALWSHVLEGAPLSELRADAVQFGILRNVLVSTGYRIAGTFTETGAILDLSGVTTPQSV